MQELTLYKATKSTDVHKGLYLYLLFILVRKYLIKIKNCCLFYCIVSISMQYDPEYFRLRIHVSKTYIFIFSINSHKYKPMPACTITSYIIIYHCKKMKQYNFIIGETYSDNYCFPYGQLIIVFPTGSMAIKKIKLYICFRNMYVVCSPRYSGCHTVST